MGLLLSFWGNAASLEGYIPVYYDLREKKKNAWEKWDLCLLSSTLL